MKGQKIVNTKTKRTGLRFALVLVVLMLAMPFTALAGEPNVIGEVELYKVVDDIAVLDRTFDVETGYTVKTYEVLGDVDYLTYPVESYDAVEYVVVDDAGKLVLKSELDEIVKVAADAAAKVAADAAAKAVADAKSAAQAKADAAAKDAAVQTQIVGPFVQIVANAEAANNPVLIGALKLKISTVIADLETLRGYALKSGANDLAESISERIAALESYFGISDVVQYTVQPGDSWDSIARKYDVDKNALWAANPAVHDSGLHPAQILTIPSSTIVAMPAVSVAPVVAAPVAPAVPATVMIAKPAQPRDLGPWAPTSPSVGENFEVTSSVDSAGVVLDLWYPDGDTPWGQKEVTTFIPTGLSVNVLGAAGRGWDYELGVSSVEVQSQMAAHMAQRAKDTSYHGRIDIDELIRLGLVEVRFDRR